MEKLQADKILFLLQLAKFFQHYWRYLHYRSDAEFLQVLFGL